MGVFTGTSVIGRQVLSTYEPISNGRMSLILFGQTPQTRRLFGHLSVELNGGGEFGFQAYDKAVWVQGLYFQVNPELLPGSYRGIMFWKVAGVLWQFTTA